MQLHILKIILWPRNREREPQQLDLSTTSVNVVTGESETGKSALLSIVDYCLGSGKCTIPVGVIRETTEWFGLHLQLSGTQILIARREPGDQRQTTDAFFLERSSIDSLPWPAKNSSIEALKSRMNELAGLSGLDFEGGEADSGFHSRASFRDMAAFNFLPQHIVANPYTLFYKADTFEHQEKLKTIFPLALGAIDNLTLLRRRELADLEREHERVRRELEAREQAVSAWMGELRTSYLRAIELGLLRDAPEPADNWTLERFIRFLRMAIESSKDVLPTLEAGSTNRVLQELARITEEEVEISREIGFRRHKLRQLQQLAQSTGGLGAAIGSQHDRLAGVGWFLERMYASGSVCPLCGSDTEAHREHLRELDEVSKELQRAASAVGDSSTVIDREMMDLRSSLRELESQLNQVRGQRRGLEALDEGVRSRRQSLEEVYRFAGGLEQAISNVDAARGDNVLAKKSAELTQRISELRDLVDRKAVTRRRDRALDLVSRNMTKHLRRLGVARPDAPVRVDLTNLTLRIVGKGDRDDFLWEIGSAANWMGYHIATFLALHEHFLTTGESPVPTFLIIDQPSQAFFPEKWPGDPEPGKGASDREETPSADDYDVMRVHQVFDTLVAACEELGGNLQILVVDHAGEITWAGLPVKMVRRWRDGKALIPESWTA